jgi:glutathione gamma-glutamylcysteinyltransferase
MLDCCVPTELVRKQGITFDEFICIANCNSIDTSAVRVTQATSLEEFRDLVSESRLLFSKVCCLVYPFVVWLKSKIK